MQYIAFDTETTGLSYSNDRLIEFGGVLVDNDTDEIIDTCSLRINPLIKVGKGAFDVHGISNAMLKDEPIFDDVAGDIIDFLSKADCSIAHNARFDVNFIAQSLWRMENTELFDKFSELVVLDTLAYARTKYKNEPFKLGGSLDALADRLGADRTARKDVHGALVDSELLANVVILIEDKENIPTKWAKDWINKSKLKEKSCES